MKRIIGLTIAALIVITVVGAGTWAYFSDTETSADNSLTAGTMDLNVDGGNTAVTTFSASAVQPGDSGSGRTTLSNVGNLTGELDIALSAITNTGATGSTEFEDGVGNLGSVARMAIYLDVDQSGGWNAGDIGLKADGTTYTSGSLQYATIDSYSGLTYDAVASLSGSASDDFTIEWQVPTSAGNNIQGDSVSFDITFTLEQADAD